MPGQNPAEAVQRFLEPLKRAVSCLGPANLSVSQGGRGKLNATHAWTLNDGAGMPLRGALGTFHAGMHYEIVLCDERHEGKWRVTTHEYAYDLVDPGGRRMWSMHWHPTGMSDYTAPHLHLPFLKDRGHFREGHRQTFETAVQWCITMGAEPARDDWEAVLAETEASHVLYRSWSEASDAPPGSR
ncbi:MAG: hypothetical protein ACR2F6_14145 [Mycobacteriales bacterium]